jgi:hypothetical protein
MATSRPKWYDNCMDINLTSPETAPPAPLPLAAVPPVSTAPAAPSPPAAPVQPKGTFWDPVNGTISAADLSPAVKKLEELYEKYRLRPGLIWSQLLVCLLILVVGEIIFIPLAAAIDEGGVVFIPAIPAALYFAHITALQRDLAKMAVARRYGWLYSPEQDAPRCQALRKLLPEIFNKGNSGDVVEDEFWGTLTGRHGQTPFWLAEFSYTVGSGRDQQHYTETVYAFALARPVPADFIVQPENVLTRLSNFFHKKDIDLESRDFSTQFNITYRGRRSDVDKGVYQTLNPAVMATLLDFRAACGKFTLVFRQQGAGISFTGKQLRMKHTNFFRKVEVDPRDIAAIDELLRQVLSHVNEIAARLD